MQKSKEDSAEQFEDHSYSMICSICSSLTRAEDGPGSNSITISLTQSCAMCYKVRQRLVIEILLRNQLQIDSCTTDIYYYLEPWRFCDTCASSFLGSAPAVISGQIAVAILALILILTYGLQRYESVSDFTTERPCFTCSLMTWFLELLLSFYSLSS